MKLTNLQILTYVDNLSISFLTDEMKGKYLPVKLNFAIQKNLMTMTQHVAVINESRKAIGEHYGKLEGDVYNINSDKMNEANKELEDLYSIIIDLPIITIKLSSILDMDLTIAQMQALMFMIEEDE